MLHRFARWFVLSAVMLVGFQAHAEPEIVVQAGHASALTSAVYSPDGQYVLTAALDSTLRLWEVRTGREIRTFSGHTGPVTDVVFLADGRRMASASMDGNVKIWDTETGKELRTLAGHTDWVNRLALAPDGRYLASASGDESVRVWEVETGREVAQLKSHGDVVSAVAFSPDGKWVVSGNGLSKYRPWPVNVVFWRTSDWREDHTITLPRDDMRGQQGITGLTFSPDSRRLMTSGVGFALGNHVRVYDVARGSQEFALQADNGFARAVFSPDGRLIATAGFDGKARLWDSASGKEAQPPHQHESWVTAVAFSPNGDTLLAADASRNATLWSVASGQKIRDLGGAVLPKTAIALTAGGILTGGRAGTLQRWNPGTGQMEVTLLRKPEIPSSIPPNNQARIFFVGRGEGGEFDAALQRNQNYWVIQQTQPARNVYALAALAATPDGAQVVYAADDHQIRSYDLASRKSSEPFAGAGHTAYVNSLALSADGRLAVSGSMDRGVFLWDVAARKKVREFAGLGQGAPGRAAAARSVAISPDGRRVAAASWDGTTRIWDAGSGNQLQRLERRNSERYWAVAFSPDGKTLATGDTQQITLWDVESGRQLRALTGHRNYIFSLAFMPDGRQLVSSSADGSVRVWDLASAQGKALPGTDAVAMQVAVTPDGRRIYAAGVDGAMRTWDAATGNLLASFVSFADGEWVTVASNGYFNTSSNGAKWLNVRNGRQIFGLEQYYDAFFRPDYVKLALQGEGLGGSATAQAGGERAEQVRAELARAERADAEARARLAQERARQETEARLKAEQLAQERARQEAEAARVKAEQAAALARAEQELAHAREEAQRTAQLADARARQEAESARLRQEQEAARLRAEQAAAQARAEEQARMQRLAEERARQEALAARLQAEQAAARVKAELDLAKARAEAEAVRLAAAATTTATAALSAAPRPGAGRVSRMEQIKPAPRVAVVGLPAKTAERQINLALQLDDAGGGVGDVRIFLNGAAVTNDGTRNLAVVAVGERRNYPVRLVSGVNLLRIVAYNADNTMQSDPVEVEVTAEFAAQRRPTLHAVVIGIQEFDNPGLNLRYSVTDADLFADVISRSGRALFHEVKITKLTSKTETTRDRILQTLDAVQKQVEPEDVFAFYVASHGTVDDGEYFLIPSNVGSTTTARLRRDAISQNDLKGRLANNPATKKFIVLDTCNSGQLGDALQVAMLTRGMNNDTAMKILSRSMGTTILSAATSTQEALEGYKDHGVFTYVVAMGLGGAADADKDGFVKTTELADYVDNEVPEIAERIFNRKQYPVISPSGQAFPIGQNRKE